MECRLIGLAGFKRSGKDTAARAFVRAGWLRVGFADAVREEVFSLFPAAADIPDDRKEEKMDVLGGKSLRDLLIEVGMGRREQDPDYWVKIARQRIEQALGEGRSVVVSDVRMENELAMIRQLGGLMLWIRRPGVTSNGHVTETDLSDRCDLVVNNLTTPEHLERKMMGVIGNHCGSCAAMERDKTFPRYGFCGRARGVDYARLVSNIMTCRNGGYIPLKGFVPPVQPKRAA